MLMIVLIVFVLIYIIVVNNGIIKSKNRVKQSKSSIDVYLNQRFDLIPNLVECVKAYMEYKKDVLETITKEREKYMNDSKKDLKEAGKINSTCNYILATAENYPDLKASEQFLELQKALTKTENQIQAARRLYNSDVTSYNTKIKTFPTVLIATLFHHKEAELFEIEDYKKENVNIDM